MFPASFSTFSRPLLGGYAYHDRQFYCSRRQHLFLCPGLLVTQRDNLRHACWPNSDDGLKKIVTKPSPFQ